MNDLLHKLETAVSHLTSQNHDGCREDNEIGWNSADAPFGHSLAHQIGSWSPGQIKAAWRLVHKYRRSQLSHLDIPPFNDDEESARRIAKIVDDRDKGAAEALLAKEGWGLQWSGPKLVEKKDLKKWFRVWAAPIPASHPFWKLWSQKKEELKAKGYALRQYAGWQISRWEPADDYKPAPVFTPKTYEIRPINTEGLLPYQHAGCAKLVASLRAYNAGVDASEVGTGKTYTALAAFREFGVSPLVVAPLSVLPSWEKAAAHIGIDIRVINWDKVRTGNTEYGRWDADKKTFLWEPNVKGLIFDEVHRAKDHKSLQHRLVAAAKRQIIPTLALSATAATNPLHLKALGYLLGLHQYKGFWQWAETYGCFSSRWGGYEFDGNPAHLKRLHAQIFAEKGVRVRVSELGDAFPETQITTELVAVADAEKINKAYQSVAEALALLAAKKATDPEHHLTKLLRARQTSELAKLPAIVEQATDALEQGLSVAIFVNFNESLATIAEHLQKTKVGVVQIHGEQSPEERQDAIEAFQTDKARVIVCNIRAGGVGVSLHDVTGRHPRLALISPSWSAIDFLQTLGRVHRAGGLSKSRQRILFAAGTVEERVSVLLESKVKNLSLLNDGAEALVAGDLSSL
jgi:superfamily II DNA or RNA helicase